MKQASSTENGTKKDKKKRRSFARRAKPNTRRGVGVLQEQNKGPAARAADGLSPARRSAVARRTPSPCFVFRGQLVFLFNVLALDFFGGGFLESFRVSFRLGLALKTPLGRNKAVRLGYFGLYFGFKRLDFILFNQFVLSFSFSSLLISCLFLFFLL